MNNIKIKKPDKKNKTLKTLFANVFNSLSFRVGFILISVILFMMTAFFFTERYHNPNVKSLFDSFWFTVVTLATVGYGDITPVTVLGRVIGIFSIFFGVIFVAAFSGKIASFLIDQQLRRGKGLLKLKKLQDHFIICGWKKDIQHIIDGVLESNSDIDISDLVLINNAPSEYMELFLTNPKYKLINFIHGDFIDESVLERSNIKNAKRILILADAASNYNQMEIDSRTILAVMTIRKLNRNIYTVAEILDEKFEKYLNMSHCDEIILTKHYERILLVNASSGTGISHVIRDLLAIENKQKITILNIPSEFVGISFKNAFDFYMQKKKSILIGLLENTGNFFARKKEALGEAQKTPDISTIVENLKKVKELRANNPILNPGFDYIIKTNSMAIVVGESKD